MILIYYYIDIIILLYYQNKIDTPDKIDNNIKAFGAKLGKPLKGGDKEVTLDRKLSIISKNSLNTAYENIISS